MDQDQNDTPMGGMPNDDQAAMGEHDHEGMDMEHDHDMSDEHSMPQMPKSEEDDDGMAPEDNA